MTKAQELAQQMMSKKSCINWDELKFKIENDKTYYFRFVPDANKENELFFQPYKMYKLSDTVYVNYPSGYNNVQKALNGLWATGDTTAKAVYSSCKGKQTYNVGIVLCDSKGNIIEPKAKIWSISSKNLWEKIMAIYFDGDFMAEPDTYFEMTRTGQKLETTYSLVAKKDGKIDFSKVESANLSLPLAFSKSDAKALPILQRLNKQFSLGVEFDSKQTVIPSKIEDDEMDEFEQQLLKEIEDAD